MALFVRSQVGFTETIFPNNKPSFRCITVFNRLFHAVERILAAPQRIELCSSGSEPERRTNDEASIGAGDGTRTRAVQLGRLTTHLVHTRNIKTDNL